MTSDDAAIPLIDSVSAVSRDRRLWLCDVWGVLHDGETLFLDAIAACSTFREIGGQVILISNSPRPAPGVAAMLSGMGVPRACYDMLVTSGDVTRVAVEQRISQPMFHLGPPRDKPFFEGLPVKLVSAEEANVIVCTGFFHEETETAEDYDALLAAFAARNAVMICANPDLVVERGNRLLPCAGALAVRYQALGQEVIQAGKPYPPIYDQAISKAKGRIEPRDILAIGDGVDTDIKGAAGLGIDAVYIASRVCLGGRAERENVLGSIQHLFLGRPFRPIAAMTGLRW